MARQSVRRDERFTLRLSRTELAAIRDVAHQRGVTPSQLVRRAVWADVLMDVAPGSDGP